MFLTRVYKEWRLLFWSLLFFVSLQLFFMAKGIENIPFFLYHMYSRDHQPMDSIPVYLVKTPGGYFDHKQLSNREEEILMNSVAYYVKLKQDGNTATQTIKDRFQKWVPAASYHYLLTHLSNDSTALTAFPQWWGNYLQSVCKNRLSAVSVVRSYVGATSPYMKSVTDSVIFTIQFN